MLEDDRKKAMKRPKLDNSLYRTFGAGKRGKGDDSLNSPFSLSVSSNCIYIADYSNHRVQVIDKESLTYMHTIGTGNPGLSISPVLHFNHPIAICIDESLNRMYVSDNHNHRIVIVNLTSGKYISTICETCLPGQDNQHLNLPQGICLDISRQILYVADTTNNRVQAFSVTNNEFIESIKCNLDSPVGLCIDEQENTLYISDWNNERIAIYDCSKRELLDDIGSIASSNKDTKFSSPYGICIDKHRSQLLVSENNNNRILVLDKETGNIIRYIGASEEFKSTVGNLHRPREIAIDKDGTIYIIDKSNHRVIIDLSRKYETKSDDPISNMHAVSINITAACTAVATKSDQTKSTPVTVTVAGSSINNSVSTKKNTDHMSLTKAATVHTVVPVNAPSVAPAVVSAPVISNHNYNHKLVAYPDVPCYIPTHALPAPCSLLTALGMIVNTDLCADIKFTVCDVAVPAHKLILAARSPVLGKLITENISRKTMLDIVIDDVSIESVKEFLNYLYTDACTTEVAMFTHVYDLLKLATRYEVSILKLHAEEIIVNCLTCSNACDVLLYAESLGQNDLMERITQYIVINAKLVMQSEGFVSLIKKRPALLIVITQRLAMILP